MQGCLHPYRMSLHQAQILRIRQKLELAHELELKLREKGKGKYRYEFIIHAPANEEDVRRFEQRHGIELPDAYRTFLVEVGNGGIGWQGCGPGPCLGIFPLGLGPTPAGEGLAGPALACPCIFRPDMTDAEWRALADSLGLDAEPYDGQRVQRAFDVLEGGLLPLGSQGCSVVHSLVLSGPHVGRIVIFDGEWSSPPVFEPDQHFLDWYERWLEDVIFEQMHR